MRIPLPEQTRLYRFLTGQGLDHAAAVAQVTQAREVNAIRAQQRRTPTIPSDITVNRRGEVTRRADGRVLGVVYRDQGRWVARTAANPTTGLGGGAYAATRAWTRAHAVMALLNDPSTPYTAA